MGIDLQKAYRLRDLGLDHTCDFPFALPVFRGQTLDCLEAWLGSLCNDFDCFPAPFRASGIDLGHALNKVFKGV